MEIFEMVHYAIPPTARITEIGSKKQWKPSAEESYRSCVVEVATTNQLNTQIELIKINCLKYGLTLQPLIVYISDTQQFGVYWDTILYESASFRHAIDLCFKTFFVFDLVYPKPSENVWRFIQNQIYNIYIPRDKYNVNISILLEKYKKLM